MSTLNFDVDIILENEVALLRPLTMEDLIHLLPFGMKEQSLWMYSLTPANGKENMLNYFKAAFEEKQAQRSYPFIVYDKRKQAYAGSTRFYDYQKRHNTIQLGYTWYGKDFQGTGLNKNCKYLMLEFAFEKLKLDRVEFRADNNNERSIAAMKSLGCTVEGVLRSNCAAATGRRDSIILSILKNEWNEKLKNNLYQKCQDEKERFQNSL